MRRALLPLVLALALTGCDDGSVTTTTAPPTMSVRVYFLRDGKLQPVRREVTQTPGVAAAALLALLHGPDDRERADLDLTTAISGTEGDVVSVLDGVARVVLNRGFGPTAKAQLVYTLTQFPGVRAVELAGRRYTRRDFEAQTPAILVESPLPFERVRSPLRARGTANTFEANVQYEIVDPDGKRIAEHFVTATSGTGTRGTFEITQPFAVDRSGLGKLVVLERSAADGSRINVVEIPLRM